MRKLWNNFFNGTMFASSRGSDRSLSWHREVGHLINNLNLCLIMAWFRCFYFWGVLELHGWCVIGNFVTSISGMNFNSAKIALFWELPMREYAYFHMLQSSFVFVIRGSFSQPWNLWVSNNLWLMRFQYHLTKIWLELKFSILNLG